MDLKRSNTAENAFLEDGGVVYGLVLAGSYTADHEMPLRRVHSTLGMTGGDGDFAAHTAAWDASDRLRLRPHRSERREGRRKVVDDGMAMIMDEEGAGHVDGLLHRYDAETSLIGAWGPDALAVVGYGDAARHVETIHQGVRDRDIAIWMGSNPNPFARGGLVIARPSLVPAPLIATFDAAQADRRALTNAALETGIERRLAEMRVAHMSIRPYMALSPRWTPQDRRSDTVHPVIFWLNPVDGRRNNHGYFTVEELAQWTQGTGPVPKSAE